MLWWASHHRGHHKHSDTPRDVHSARQRGFWCSHMGWILRATGPRPTSRGPRPARFPELRWLEPHGICCRPSRWRWASPDRRLRTALVWGFFVSTVLLWHGTFAINSLAHVFGRRRYATDDDSRNNWLLALLTCGEGWHNNHHHYQSSARQGFRWWEIDVTYYLLRAMSLVGLVWDLRRPPRDDAAAEAKAPAARPAPIALAARS